MKRILLAFSGGPDSTYLLIKLLEKGRKVDICYINHMIREEAFKEEEFAKRIARRFGIRCFIVRANVPRFASKHGISLELAGRMIRYRILRRIAYRYGYTFIATAHHLNDAFETYIFNSIRGTGISGLILKPRRGMIVRPIILKTKHEILKHLEERNIKYMQDPTNFLTEPSRNYIRNVVVSDILERFPKAVENFRKTYLNLYSIYRKLRKEAKSLYERALLYKDENMKVFKLEELKRAEGSILEFLISRLVKEPTREHVLRCMHVIHEGGKINLPRNFFIESQYGLLFIYRKVPRFQGIHYIHARRMLIYSNGFRIEVSPAKHSDVHGTGIYIPSYRMNEVCMLRPRIQGDRIRRRKLKDILIRKRIPRVLRDILPVLSIGNEVVFVPFVERLDFKVKDTSYIFVKVESRYDELFKYILRS